MSRDKVVLITGAAGFLGTYIARDFACDGWRVVGVGRSPAGAEVRPYLRAYYEAPFPGVDMAGIVTEHKPSVCVHAAGGSSVPLSINNPRADFEAGPVGTFEVLESLRVGAPECRTIFLSSAAVYGDPASLPIRESDALRPISPYGFHKMQSEQLCAQYSTLYGMNTASVRIFSAYGPGLRKQVVWDMCSRALRDGILMLRGTGEESRDFVHAEDVAKAVRVLLQSAPLAGERYNLASGAETTIKALAQLVLDALRLDRVVEFDGSAPPGTPRNWRADVEKISALGVKPSIPLAEGIAAFAKWCRSELE